MLNIGCHLSTTKGYENMGKEAIYIDDENNWTVYTEDGLPSAQWEIQVLVTEEGTEVISWQVSLKKAIFGRKTGWKVSHSGKRKDAYR